MLAADAPAGQTLAPIPSPVDRGKADKTLRELFKKEFARQDAESRKALAVRLMSEATQGADPAATYVLLQDSSDLAASAGDVKDAFRALDLLASTFAVNGFELKANALAAATKAAKSPADAAALAQASLLLVDDAMSAGQFDTAAKLAGQAETDARASKDVGIFAAAHAKSDNVQAAVHEAQKVKASQEKLRQHPDDPTANLQVGKFLCFVKGDWEQGLPHLAIGSDAALAKTAKQDMANPTEAKAELATAEVWSALSEDVKAGVKIPAARRAAFWYRKAIPDLTGLEKVAAQKHLWEMARIANGAHMTAYKLATDGGEPVLLPLTDPSPDVLTLTQQPMGLHISGTKMFDVASVAGSTRGHLGKAALFAGNEAGGSLHVEVAASGDHTYYNLLLTDIRDVPHLKSLGLDKGVDYTWEVLEKDGNVVLSVSKDDKEIGSISLPSQEYKSFGFGVTVRWPGNKGDLTVSLD